MANLLHGAANSPGPYGAAVGWVNFQEVPALSPGQSYNLTATEPGVGTLSFTLVSRGPIAQTQTTGPGKIGSAYFGLAGNVGMGSTKDNSNTITIEINNISFRDLSNNPIPNFKVLMMDNETTVEGEFWQIQTNGGGWTYEGIVPIGGTMGIDPAVSGVGTQTYKQTGVSGGGGNTSPIMSSLVPSQIIFSSQNNATQIFTFGVYVPANESIEKAVDKTFTNFGDTITYTITIKNPSFIPLTGVVLIDSIPNGTTYLANSLTVDSVPNSGDIQTGISISTIPQLTNVVVKFSVVVSDSITQTTIPNKATMNYNSGGSKSKTSNTVNTFIFQPRVSVLKENNTEAARPGDTITYTLIVTNTGTTPINNTVITDTIPVGTAFLQGSLIVDGVSIPNGTIAPTTGVNIGTVGVNGVRTINFSVTVVSLPPGDIVVNYFDTNYTYISIPNGRPVLGELISNTTTVPIRYIDLNKIVKGVDKLVIRRGETITYTITIPNNGNIPVFNSILLDTAPNGTVYLNNTLLVNGVPSNSPISSIFIGTIPAFGVSTVSFQVIGI